MQEHPQYKITPEQGWSQMQPILEKVIPVGYRSRRFIVFWWATAAAILVAISSVILLKEKPMPVDPGPITTPPTEMTSNDNKASVNENQSISSSISMPGDNTSAEKSDQKNTNLLEQSHQKAASPSSSNKLTSNYSAKSIIENKSNFHDNITSAVQQVSPGIIVHQVDVVENKTVAIEKSEYVNSIQTQSAVEIPGEENEINKIQRSIPSLGFLPLINVMQYEYNPNNIDLIEPGRYTSSFSRRPVFNPNVSVGGIVGSQNGLGINAGIGSDYAISSRLSLTANIGFRSYHPEVLSLGNEESYALLKTDLAYEGIGNYLPGEEVNPSADYKAINSFIHSVRQWQVSSGLKYEVTRRFFIEGGIAFEFGTTAKSEYPIVTFNSNASLDNANIARSFNSYNVIRSNMTSVYGGLGYRMNRHFIVYAQWTHGLDQYLLNDQVSAIESTTKRSDYLRGLNIGLRYQL